MKLKHNDLIPEKGKAFEKCKLGREKYAKVLTSIVETYADGFVLAINNEWGAGKTTFVKMWRQYLDDREFDTLYFNAWENDFEDNPLVALMAELKTLLPKSNKSAYENLTKKAAVFFKNVVPALAKGVAKQYIDSDTLVDGIEEATKGATEILKDEIDNHLSKKKGLIDFKKELEKFVVKHNNSKPLIFIIDELDRCRPDYAVKVLEHVKHFFGVSGIVFVLSIDKKQLGNSIRGFYGSEKIDADNYLKRFVDLEFKIPEPNTGEFCRYLFEYYRMGDFFYSEYRRGFGSTFSNDGKNLLDMASILFEFSKIPLRTQEKIFSHARVALKTYGQNEYILSYPFIFLVYLKEIAPDFFKRLVDKRITTTEISENLIKILPQTLNVNVKSILIRLEAELLYRVWKSAEFRTETLIVIDESTGNKTCFLKSVIDPDAKQSKFIDTLEMVSRNWETNDVGLDYLLNKVSLVDDIIS